MEVVVPAEDEEEEPLDAEVDSPSPLPYRRRVSLSDDQGQSAKLALVEALAVPIMVAARTSRKLSFMMLQCYRGASNRVMLWSLR